MARSTLPRGVIVLGLVSLFMDLSSEMIHSLLPLFMVTVLGANAFSVGVIEGIAEATASITKIFSGVISDWIGRRKFLVLLGYGLAAMTKPLFPLAGGIGAVLIARFLDRVGKGIRGAPRDALIADITPPESRGAAYGLRQSMDTVGAFAGPLLAMGLMSITHDNFRVVFWVAVLPAIFCVLLIVFGVKEPGTASQATSPGKFPISKTNLQRLPDRFWWVVAFSAILTLARFSEAFLLLRAKDMGLSVALVPSVLILMNVVYAVSAYPFGKLSDNCNRRSLLVWGIGFLIVADILLAVAGSIWMVFVGVAAWGLHMGATQGLLSALVSDSAPSEMRGTAFGVFNLVGGLALFGASIMAGGIWTAAGPAMTFCVGACFSCVALAVLIRLGAEN